MNRYLEAAMRTYQKLFPLLSGYGNYWQLGHVIDTLLDYWFTATYPPIPPDALDTIVQKYLDRQSLPWEKEAGKDPWWYDDFCWWGIACLRAEQKPIYFYNTNYVKLFRGICDLNWQPAYRNAPNVWANADQQAFADFEPLFPNGVWNWIYEMRTIKGLPFTPSVPGEQDKLRGMQNTVTNALYWVLMARLNIVRKSPQFKTEAEKEYNFLKAWFNYDDASKEVSTSLLYRYDKTDPTRALVRERVSVYKNGNYVPGYFSPGEYDNSNLVWAGDQGLMLGGALAHLDMDVSPGLRTELLTLAKAITQGVIDKLKGDHGNLLPWSPYRDPDDNDSDHGAPGGDYNDYSTGIGVYMRYLLDAYNRNADIRKHLVDIGYPAFVKSNAEYVIQHQDDPDRQGEPILNYANDLASLLVAFKMTATAEELEQHVKSE